MYYHLIMVVKYRRKVINDPISEEALWESLEPPLREACEKFVQTRILEHNIQKKENEPSIPATGMAVLRQQYVLVEAIQEWISSLNII